MTSFSTYASRFLASGASAAPLPHNNAPSAFQRSLYQPYDSSEYTSPFRDDGQGVDDEDDDDEDNGDARDTINTRSIHQRTLPPLQAHPMSGSSRLLAQLTGRSSKLKMGSIRDIDDEDEQDGEEDSSFLQNQASRGIGARGTHLSSILDDQSTPAASMYAAKDDQDPFLVDAEVGRKSGKSKGRVRKISAEAKSKGWLAHAADSSSNASASSYRATPKRSGRRSMPDDIYRDPDELVDDDEPERPRQFTTGTKGKARASGDVVSGDDGGEDEDDDRTSIATTTDDESQYEAGATSGRTWRAGRRDSRKNNDAQRRSASSLRQPLLSSAGSEVLGDQPPGAYKGTTSQLASADIYAYPHPPAQSGWTPWAPGNRVPLSQYKDKAGLVGWLGLCAGTLFVAGFMAIEANSVSAPSSPSTRPSPYYTLTRSIPILFLLTFLSVAAAIANLVLLRNLSRVGGATIIRNGLIAVPLLLCVGWMWAFASSFIYEDEKWSGGGWSTTGLRILSIIPLALAIYFARNVWRRRDSISRSLSVLELSALIVAKHPVLLLLSLCSLGAFVTISAPFLTIFVRLFLRGHLGSPNGASNVWHTDASARLMGWLTLVAWIWSWLVLRGIQRVTVAGVVSHWYFHRQGQDDVQADTSNNDKLFDVSRDNDEHDEEGLPGPAPGEWLGEEQISLAPPSHVDIVRASFIRATGSALGTVCLSALMLSVARVGILVASSARWAHRKMSSSSRIPSFLHPLTHLVALLAGISALLQGLSDYALIYVGVTGDGFAAAARRSTRLTSKQSIKSVMEGMVINTLLDLTTLAFCFLAGLTGFLISAHNLHVPADAPLVGLLCAFVPYALLRLCADVLANAADTLYLCFSIDEASGEQHCKQASDAFLSTDEQLPF